jgi:2-methylcitrate dehydratase
MEKEFQTRQIADFVLRSNFKALNESQVDQLKKHLLDSLGSLIHATGKPALHKLMRQFEVLGDNGSCWVPGLKRLPFDRAAQFYTALIRYPDFMDNFLGKEATCHPSDNIGALLAACQNRETTGEEFLTAMCIAYQLECRLVEEIPVMKEGIDHTLFLSFSIVGAVSKILGLTKEQTAHALAIAGCSISPMVTSRASYTYEWKGFASSQVALTCMNIIFLAQQGMTGPIALFEGPKGFHEIFNMKLDYDWSKEDFSLIKRCILKSYNAEVHTQSALEAALELKQKYSFQPEEIEKITITTFLTAYHITGSGAYGDRKNVETKEQADHSLFYLVAVALLDDQVDPEQFEPERIQKDDVQKLLQKIDVHTKSPLHKPLIVAGVLDPYTQVYPDKVKTKVEITLKNGRQLSCEKDDYEGFFTRPLTWEKVIQKFQRLCTGIISPLQQHQIIETVKMLDQLTMDTLIKLISDIPSAIPQKDERETLHLEGNKVSER